MVYNGGPLAWGVGEEESTRQKGHPKNELSINMFAEAFDQAPNLHLDKLWTHKYLDEIHEIPPFELMSQCMWAQKINSKSDGVGTQTNIRPVATHVS